MSIDVEQLKRLDELASAIHGKGTTVEMLNRWAAFESACKPELIQAMVAELGRLKSRERAQEIEAEDVRVQFQELDLMFGRYLLGMRASVVEWQKGKGADAAMQWIWNGLAGPGELPPEGETQAQAYFDREVAKIEEGLEEVYAYRDKRRAEKAKERGL